MSVDKVFEADKIKPVFWIFQNDEKEEGNYSSFFFS